MHAASPRSPADSSVFLSNCGFWVKSTKLGTLIDFYMLNNIGYGPQRKSACKVRKKRVTFHITLSRKDIIFIPEPTGVSPGRGLLIPLGYLHPGKCEHSEVQSHPPLCNGRWMVFVVMRMRESSLISKIWRTT